MNVIFRSKRLHAAQKQQKLLISRRWLIFLNTQHCCIYTYICAFAWQSSTWKIKYKAWRTRPCNALYDNMRRGERLKQKVWTVESTATLLVFCWSIFGCCNDILKEDAFGHFWDLLRFLHRLPTCVFSDNSIDNCWNLGECERYTWRFFFPYWSPLHQKIAF